MKNIVSLLVFLYTICGFAQQNLSLEECYQLLNTNYPLAKQNELLNRQNSLNLAVISTQKKPQVTFSAQTTYQSDVVEFPIPNPSIEPLNKDQYRATVSVNQLIYAGGLIDASLDAKTASLKTRQKQVEVNLYQLKRKVNQLYFSILLIREKGDLLTSKKELLEARLKEIKSGIKNGILIPSADKVMEVELLKIEQQFSELELTKSSLIHSLASLIGKDIPMSTALQKPQIICDFETDIKRPELTLFQLKNAEIETAEQVVLKQNAPKIMGLATGGYGNPGLNMLDNSFQGFYTVGVKLNWNVFDWQVTKKRRESLSVNKDIIANEKEIFNLNTNIELQQHQAEIQKISGFISSDTAIINLRKEVLKSAESQLKNGVITTSDYITEITNLYEDENRLSTHKIQLLLAKATYNITKGL